VVKGIIPRSGLVVVWGAQKCGKSFWTFDLLMHVALGRAYRGRRVQQGGVVYLALEGGSGFSRRVEAWRRCHGYRGPAPFHLIGIPIDIIADHVVLIADIRAQTTNPSVVCIDTLNRGLNGSENKDEDMARFIRAADAIHGAFGCVVVIVHHCGVARSRPRGHTSLSCACDAQIAVERKDNGSIIAKVEHMKDGEAGATVASRLERVELVPDRDGDMMTSCVIVPTEAAAAQQSPKLSATTKLAYDLLRTFTATEGKPPAPGDSIPAAARAVSAITWRERFYDSYPTTKPDTKQKAYVRAVLKLQEEKLIEIWSTYAWLTP
jgi:hypothetical protein